MEIAQEASVKVLRPREYDSFPTFEPTLVESCLNRFKLVVDPLYFDAQRASFSWKAPGNGLVCSNNAFIEMSFDVQATGAIDIKSMSGPLSREDNDIDIAAAIGADLSGAAETSQARDGMKLCFGAGDAFAGAISSVQLVANGAVLSNTRLNDYANTLDECWVHESVMQKRFSRCGGAPDRYDTVCVSGRSFAADAKATKVGSVIEGYTADSGIARRCENLLQSTFKLSEKAGPSKLSSRKIRVRAPLRACGIFSPVSWADEVSESCPWRQSTIAIPNLNSVQIDLLFQNLEDCIVRNIGALGTNVSVTLDRDVDKPTLHVEYLRLDGSRFKPKFLALPAFKIAVHDPNNTTENNCHAVGFPAAATKASINRILKPLIMPRGYGRGIKGRDASFLQDSFITCQWKISSAQVAPYIAFMMQKTSDMYAHATARVVGGPDLADAAAVATGGNAKANGDFTAFSAYNLVRNTNANASIQKFELEIASTVGSYTYSSETFPFLRSRDELWADVTKYTVRDFARNDIGVWKRAKSVVLLGAQDFVRGLTSPNTAYPIQYTARIQFGNERCYLDGNAATAIGAGQDDTELFGAIIHKDYIAGRPVMLEIFDKVSLKLSPGAGLVTSQNSSHSAAQSEIHMRR